MKAESRIRPVFGKLDMVLVKKRKKLLTMIPAPAAMQPIRNILKGLGNPFSP
jgi:hypothetical protein